MVSSTTGTSASVSGSQSETASRTPSGMAIQAFSISRTDTGLGQTPGVGPAHRDVLADQAKARFSSSTRSVFSQEKPPSASGVRPKWP